MANEPMRLLIAEDEDSVRCSIEAYIRKHTHVFDEVYTAATGQEALDNIFRYRTQVMLLDIQMPVKDGLTVLKEATAAGVCPRTIILSGHDAFRYAQQAIRYSVADYLLKPCRSTELLEKLEALAAEEDENALPAPAEASAPAAAKSGHQLVEEALRYMQEHYPEPITQPEVAQVLGVSASYLSTLFSRHGEMGFAECLNRIRIERACDYFVDLQMKTYEVAFRVGFRDEKYFSNVFKKVMGIAPSQYRKQKKHGQA